MAHWSSRKSIQSSRHRGSAGDIRIAAGVWFRFWRPSVRWTFEASAPLDFNVVREIDAGAIDKAYRGSLLQTAVGSLAEQRQTFEWAADHSYLWKPELRIPDVRRSTDDQRAFARLLRARECSHMRAVGWN